MLRKQSENMNSLDPFINHDGKKDYRKEMNERQPEMKQEKTVQKDRSWADPKTAKSSYGDTIARNGSSIRSSRCASEGGITDMGGSKNQPGFANGNTIWNNDNLSKVAENLSSKEATQMEKESSERIRQKKQAEYKQSLLPKVGAEDVLVNKSASVSSANAKGSGKGWIPSNKISMFDNNTNFDRLTAVENRVSPKVEKETVKKAKVHNAKQIKTAKQATDKLVDALMDENKDSNYKSVHNDAVERLYQALTQKPKES
jgi:hypothetical protein